MSNFIGVGFDQESKDLINKLVYRLEILSELNQRSMELEYDNKMQAIDEIENKEVKKKTSKKTSKKKASKKAEPKEDKKEQEATSISYPEVVAAMHAYAKEVGPKDAMNKLKAFGVDKLKELPVGDFEAFLKTLES